MSVLVIPASSRGLTTPYSGRGSPTRPVVAEVVRVAAVGHVT